MCSDNSIGGPQSGSDTMNGNYGSVRRQYRAGGQASIRSANIFCLSSSFSGAASVTKSACSTARRKFAVTATASAALSSRPYKRNVSAIRDRTVARMSSAGSKRLQVTGNGEDLRDARTHQAAADDRN